NLQKRHLWPGINIDFGGDALNVDETVNQIMLTRGMLPESKGSVHWSIGPLLKYPNVSKALLDGPYQKEALVPASLWMNAVLPAAPKVDAKVVQDKVKINWDHAGIDEVFKWVVYFKYNGVWSYEILSRTQNSFELSYLLNKNEKGSHLTNIGVTAVDRTGNESDFIEVSVGG
ncbi:MAG: hypothetical protein ACQEQB_08850, partial [Bacteroidota bacterium]